MKIVAIGLLALVLSACAVVYEQKYDYRDGWRKGRVVQVGTRDELKLIPDSDCVKNVAEDQLVVLISHVGSGSPVSYHAVAIPKKISFAAGDLIYVNISHCDEPLIHRTAE